MSQKKLDFALSSPVHSIPEGGRPKMVDAAVGVSPWVEMGAYEALWTKQGQSFKRMANKFRGSVDPVLPSHLVLQTIAIQHAQKALEILEQSGVRHFGVRIFGTGDYPDRLRDAANPVQLIYYQGHWDLLDRRSVSIVGTRQPSDGGKKEAADLARLLVGRGFNVMSGLAHGIDTVAHTAAIEAGGWTIGVLGTPLSVSYPKQNAALQRKMAKEHLLISQVPVVEYENKDWRWNRGFFPQRNVTMAALSDATVIVEAGEGSGTLTQARAALAQGRKLFLMDRCFHGHEWPLSFEAAGAIRVRRLEEILDHLGQVPANPA